MKYWLILGSLLLISLGIAGYIVSGDNNEDNNNNTTPTTAPASEGIRL